MSKEAPRWFFVSEERRALAAQIEQELLTWPQVRSRPMFSMTGIYRGKKIFACLPRKRILRSPNAFLLKFHRPLPASQKNRREPRLHIGEKWSWLEIESTAEVPIILRWLEVAHRLAR